MEILNQGTKPRLHADQCLLRCHLLSKAVMYKLIVAVSPSKQALFTKKAKAINVISTVKYHTKAVPNLLLRELHSVEVPSRTQHPGP